MSELDRAIAKTQAALSPLFSKPKCTKKLLSKPPFRFIHDIVTATLRSTGFPGHLYAPSELDSSSFVDKRQKLDFLERLIALVGLCLGAPLPTRAAKVVAGLEPVHTNALLAGLGAVAADGGLDHAAAVRRCLAGEVPREGGEIPRLTRVEVPEIAPVEEGIAADGCDGDPGRTREMVETVVARPRCTDKLLGRPPFRFLHDLFLAVGKSTGFGMDIYSDDELNSANLNNKEMKIRFLQKVVRAVERRLDLDIDVQPAKIVAGLESDKTRKFLQFFIVAAKTKETERDDKVLQKEEEAPAVPPTPKNSDRTRVRSAIGSTDLRNADVELETKISLHEEMQSDSPRSKMRDSKDKPSIKENNLLERNEDEKKHDAPPSSQLRSSRDDSRDKPSITESTFPPDRNKDEEKEDAPQLSQRPRSVEANTSPPSSPSPTGRDRPTFADITKNFLSQNVSGPPSSTEAEKEPASSPAASPEVPSPRPKPTDVPIPASILGPADDGNDKPTRVTMRPMTARRRPPKVEDNIASLDEYEKDGVVRMAGALTSQEKNYLHDFFAKDDADADADDARKNDMVRQVEHSIESTLPGISETGNVPTDGGIRLHRTGHKKLHGAAHPPPPSSSRPLNNTEHMRRTMADVQVLVQYVTRIGACAEYVPEDLERAEAERERLRAEHEARAAKLAAARRTSREALASLREDAEEIERKIEERGRAMRQVRARMRINDVKIETWVRSFMVQGQSVAAVSHGYV